MFKKDNPLNLHHLIRSNFEKAKEIEAEAAERSKKAEKRSIENRKEIINRQEEFRRKWQ